MKKIISFSLWGSNSLYCDGAVWNAEHANEFYPGWTCRFYHDDSVNKKILKKLAAAGSELILMGKSTDALGMFWRFLPMNDVDTVERFIVRDTDSKLTEREVSMVNQWVSNTKPFHIIRDCESHQTTILGGTWGAVPGCVRGFDLKVASFMTTLIPDNKNPRGIFHGCDQMFLHNFIWPLIKDNHCAHILAGYPKLRYTHDDIEVPAPEDGHYVGMVC